MNLITLSKKDFNDLIEFGACVSYVGSYFPGDLCDIYHYNRFRYAMILARTRKIIILICY